MDQICGIGGWGWRPVTLAIAIALGAGTQVLAADQIDDALSDAGKVWYEKYCTPCHGPGGAPGKAVSRATKEPVDLRTYVQSHGGKFPVNDWLAVIADARPGGEHAKVWRTIKQTQGGSAGKDTAARGVLGAIARYIMSVQTK
jgi:mono/diheme cytochrome c family protein